MLEHELRTAMGVLVVRPKGPLAAEVKHFNAGREADALAWIAG